jgi:ABC-type branched-subunit amino acid transport system substrate-binding protein
MVIVATGFGGCSVIVNRDDTQCHTDLDCAKFAATMCDHGGCVPRSQLDASPDTGANESCTCTSECNAKHDQFWVCSRVEKKCISLVSRECPVVLYPSPSDEVVVVGALVPIVEPHKSTGTAMRNMLQLAADDFQVGLPAIAPSTNRRPVSVVICDDSPNSIDLSARHLANDVHVAGVLGPSSSAKTLQVAADFAMPGQLVISPSATSDLSAVNGAGLVWRTVPTDDHQAAAMAATMQTFVESYVKTKYSLSSIKVQLIHQDDVYGHELDTALGATLRFNNALASAQLNTNFFDVSYGNPDDPMNVNPDQGYSTAVGEVSSHKPDVIIVAGSTQAAANVVGQIEQSYTPVAAHPPFYLLSSGLLVQELLTTIGTTDLHTRLLVTAAGSDPTTGPFATLLARYHGTRFGDPSLPESFGAASIYDAFYALMYGIARVTNADIVGKDISSGMQTLYAASATAVAVDIGPGGLSKAFKAISMMQPISLNGASGALAFDVMTGNVVTDILVWCVVRGGTALSVEASGMSWASKAGMIQGSVSSRCLN